MKGKLQLFTFFYFAWASTQMRLLPLEAPTSNYTSTNLFLFSGNNQRDATTPQRTRFSLAPPYHPDFSLNYRMNQTLTNPHCLWLGFINQHLHYDSELDSVTDIHNRCYNSISVHFSLFLIKTKHIQNSPRLSLYHSSILSHLDPFIIFSFLFLHLSSVILLCSSYSATINLYSSSYPALQSFSTMCSISYIRNYLTEQCTQFHLLAIIYIYIFQSIPILSVHYRNGYGLFIFHLTANEKQLIGLECWSVPKKFTFHEYHRFSKVSNWKNFKSFEYPVCLTLCIPRIVILCSGVLPFTIEFHSHLLQITSF